MSLERENNAIRQLLKQFRKDFNRQEPILFVGGRYNESNLHIIGCAVSVFCVEEEMEVDKIGKGIHYDEGDTHYSRGILIVLKEIKDVSDKH